MRFYYFKYFSTTIEEDFLVNEPDSFFIKSLVQMIF